MPETKARLPRRYDAVLKTLRELMASRNEKVKLTATLRYAEILAEHDRSQERIAVAAERAAARKAMATETAEQTAQREAEEAARAAEKAKEAAERDEAEKMERMIDRLLKPAGVEDAA